MPDLEMLLATLTLIGALAPVIVVPALVALIDFVTIWRANRIIKRDGRLLEPVPHPDIGTPFEILVPIFGDMRYLKNVDFLAEYPGRVILCTTDKETPEFEREITRIALRHDFRIFRSDSAGAVGRPNPWRLFSRTLTHVTDRTRDEIMRDSYAAVTAPVCIFLDGDTVAADSLQVLVDHFVAKELELSSVRVRASRRKTLAECLQGIEYDFAMDARRVYPWLTSGACMVARTEAMREIMSTHSLFFSGGDIEIGKLAKLLKMRVGHVPFDLFTDVPETFRAWFKQRMAWFGGGFRHAVINANVFAWRQPFFFFYFTIVIYSLTPIRWYEVIHHPWIPLMVISIYVVLLFIMRTGQKPLHLMLFPIYALVQVMIVIPCGIYTYFKMALRARSLGLIRLRESAFQPVIEVDTVVGVGTVIPLAGRARPGEEIEELSQRRRRSAAAGKR